MAVAARIFALPLLCILFIVAVRGQDADFCFSNDVRITDSVETSEPIGNGLINETVYGLLEICVDGVYRSVCNGSGIDPEDIARRACENLGYYEGWFV